MPRQLTTLALFFCFANPLLSAQDSRPALNAEQVKFYIDQVAPILVNNCFACHGPGSSVKGELYLGNRQDILKGGETGPAVDLENPMDSLLIQAMLYQDIEMPPKGKLPQSQIDIIIKWVTNDMPIPPDRERRSQVFLRFARRYRGYQRCHRPTRPVRLLASSPRGLSETWLIRLCASRMRARPYGLYG